VEVIQATYAPVVYSTEGPPSVDTMNALNSMNTMNTVNGMNAVNTMNAEAREGNTSGKESGV